MLIIEAKSSRPIRSTFVSDDENSITKAINKLYIEPTLQANNAYENIMKSNHEAKFGNIREIYIITVSLENIPFTREVKQKVDEKLKSSLNNKVKGYCNLNIEEYELLCSLINNNINAIDIIKNYCEYDDVSSLKNFVKKEYLNLKMQFVNNIFTKFTDEMIEYLFK